MIPGSTTIGDLCALVMDNHRLRELRRTRMVEYVLNAHILPVLGRLPAARFGSAQVKQYILQRQEEGASNATMNRELALVGRGFKLGYEAEPKLVFQIPVIHKLPEGNARQGFLEPDQYERLLEELPANLKTLFVCGYHTGARKGELRAIQWPQVDFDAASDPLAGGSDQEQAAPYIAYLWRHATLAEAPARNPPDRVHVGVPRGASRSGRQPPQRLEGGL